MQIAVNPDRGGPILRHLPRGLGHPSAQNALIRLALEPRDKGIKPRQQVIHPVRRAPQRRTLRAGQTVEGDQKVSHACRNPHLVRRWRRKGIPPRNPWP